MISLKVDEAFAFDYLSILEVKIIKGVLPPVDAYTNGVRNFIAMQIGAKKFEEIIQSPEFKGLVKANEEVFDLIERTRNGEALDAKLPDIANMERFKCKKEIQKKYFDTDLIEAKSLCQK
jgi:hypothetical protein